MDFTNVTKALTARGFKVSSFETAKEAAEYLNSQIDGATVGFGGSITLEELGLYALLSGHNTVFSHWHLPEGGETVSLPVEKDDTDMAAAIGIGRGRGYRRFYLLGGTGGRPDHTYANYQLLADCARRGEEAILFGVGFRAAAIADGARLTFPADATGTLSVFSACGEATGVSERGVYYPLSGATLSGTFPLGVSNHFLPGEAAEISVGAGVLLVFFEGNILPEFS